VTLLLILGVMDLRIMVIITAANMLERLTPNGERLAKWMGVISLAAGIVLLCFAKTVAGS
jgi:predicted metal-binding membrane protein